MKHSRSILLIIAVMLCLLCFFVNKDQYNKAEHIFEVKVSTPDGEETVVPWTNDNGEVYIFLPGYVKMDAVTIRSIGTNALVIDGEAIENERNCADFVTEVPYALSYKAWGEVYQGTLMFFQSANVATMYIETASGDMEYIHSQKRNEEAGTMRLYQADGSLVYDGQMKSIAGRGNTTWDDVEKKPYTIDLGTETDLLDMGSARDWVLLANAFDPSHMRNKIVFDFAREAGLAYSPESQWVDLYLNGEYAGLYLLSEQNEVHTQRVAIEGEGSFLVSLERHGRMVTQNLPFVETEAAQTLRVRYPKDPTDNQLAEIEQLWQSTENAILAEDGIDPETGKHWLDLIDLDSWVRKYLVEEIFGSLDACYISQYFYYDTNEKDAKVKAGPVWDYDWTMGRPWQSADWDFLIANRAQANFDYKTPWFHELYKKAEFHERMKEIYQDEFLPLLTLLIDQKIEQYDDQVMTAAEMNSKRWITESYDVNTIRGYLQQRTSFLSQLWLNEKKYHTIEIRNEGSNYVYYLVEKGKTAVDLPSFESSATRTFVGWCDENGMPFDEYTPIYEDKVICAQWEGLSSAVTGYAQYYVPLAIIACMGAAILWADIRRSRKGG